MKTQTITTLILAFALSTVPFLAKAESVNAEEANAVVASLSNPENPTAVLLNASIEAAKNLGLTIDSQRNEVTKLGENSYTVKLSLNSDEATEYSLVSIEEVLIRNGKAYIFDYNISRALKMIKYPGVNLGNQ